MEGVVEDEEFEPREEEDEVDQDVEEFNSGEEGSARGTGGINVKQLSSIDEEEDCERRTLGMSSVRGGGGN